MTRHHVGVHHDPAARFRPYRPEQDRAAPDAELAFPPACLYRPLRLRPPSAGDVDSVCAQGRTTWLACIPFGGRPSTTPAHISGRAPATDTVHRHRRMRWLLRRLRGNDA